MYKSFPEKYYDEEAVNHLKNMNKKNDLIPQYLQDELQNLVRIKPTYTNEEMEQTKHDYIHVKEQIKQLEKAEEYGVIPKEEAAITNLTLYVMKHIIEETIRDMLRFLKAERDAIQEEINILKRGN